MARAHSKLGASKAERWLNCPGSVSLCETVPEPPQSPYAAEGSAAHYFAEVCLSRGWNPGSKLLLGKSCPDFPEWPLTFEMGSAVQTYVDFVRSLACGPDGLQYPFASLHIEHRFSLDYIDSDLFGTADAVVYHDFSDHLHVIDYKHGKGVIVSPIYNAQLMYYALGAQLLYPFTAQVSIHVVQPRGPGKAVKTWEPTLEDLADYAENLRHGVEAVREHDAPLASGPWCRFCPAKPVCPKHHEKRQAQATLEFEDVGQLLEDL